MYVGAVSLSVNPYDIAREAGLRIRDEKQQAESSTQKTAQQTQYPQQEKVVQGEVLSRQRIQNADISSTNDTLSKRQFSHQQAGLSYNSKQAVNTYIANQSKADALEQNKHANEDGLIDVYV